MVLEISCVFHSRTLDMDGLFDDGKIPYSLPRTSTQY